MQSRQIHLEDVAQFADRDSEFSFKNGQTINIMNLRPMSFRALTFYYVTALLVIAGLSIVSHALLSYGLRSSQGSAAIINVTGRQRMLSQRIASLAGQIQLGNKSARADLKKAIGEFESAHDALALTSRSIVGADAADQQLSKLYYDDDHRIDLQVCDYIANARRVLDPIPKFTDMNFGMIPAVSCFDSSFPIPSGMMSPDFRRLT